MKILSLDIGTKRIGIAKADSSVRIATPIGYIDVDGTEWSQIKHFANLNNTNLFVLGMPRSNEGSETQQSLYVRNFAKTLTEKIPDAKIYFQDESLTSVEAENRLKARKKNYEKGEIDAESAAIILQDFIEHFSEKKIQQPETNLIKKNTEKVMLKTKKVAKKSKRIKALMITPISLAVLAFCIIGCLLWYNDSLTPVVKKCGESECNDIAFTISDGERVDSIAEKLKNASLIKSQFFFKVYLKLHGLESNLKSGDYLLNKGLSVSEIIDLLVAGTKDSNVFTFTIVPGDTMADIRVKLSNIGYSAHEIEKAFNRRYDDTIMKNIPNTENYSLEGYLFGETHEFYKGTSVEDIILTYATDLEKVVDENNLEEKFQEQGLTLHEGIILASLIQGEVYPEDQPTVAQVFLSRLKIGMPLGSDASVTYAIDLIDPMRTTYTNNYDALRIDSCYNTRKYQGLPCGAIGSPSISALKAVANPTDTDYLYFLTGDDDLMYYSHNADEHERAAHEHCKVRCNISL